MRGAAIEESLALPLPRLPLLGTLGKQTVSLNVPLHSLRVGASDRQMAVFRAWPIIQATALRKACRHRPLLIQELQLLAAPAVLPGAPPTGLRSLEYLALWPRKSEGCEVFFEMCRLRAKEGEISSRLCLA